jgi:hypothetical protein
MNKAQAILTLLSPPYLSSRYAAQEAGYALARGLRVVPILMPAMEWTMLNSNLSLMPLRKHFGFEFKMDPVKDREAFEREVDDLVRFLRTAGGEAATSSKSTSDDPNRARFGGRSERDGYALTAKVLSLGDDWFDIQLQVSRKDAQTPLYEVEFHLHPTFEPSVRTVTAQKGVATLQVDAWGAFTVGAVVLKTFTQLELDLASVTSAPKSFRAR